MCPRLCVRACMCVRVRTYVTTSVQRGLVQQRDSGAVLQLPHQLHQHAGLRDVHVYRWLPDPWLRDRPNLQQYVALRTGGRHRPRATVSCAASCGASARAIRGGCLGVRGAEGTEQTTVCPQNTYSNPNSFECTACPTGSTSSAGASTCICSAGSALAGSGDTLVCTRTAANALRTQRQERTECPSLTRGGGWPVPVPYTCLGETLYRDPSVACAAGTYSPTGAPCARTHALASSARVSTGGERWSSLFFRIAVVARSRPIPPFSRPPHSVHGGLVQCRVCVWLHRLPGVQHERWRGALVLVQPWLHDHGLWPLPAVRGMRRQHVQRQRHVVCGMPARWVGRLSRQHVLMQERLHHQRRRRVARVLRV